MNDSVAYMETLPWVLRQTDQVARMSYEAFWGFASLVLFAYMLCIYNREITATAAGMFNFGNWGKPLRFPVVSEREKSFRRIFFFFLAWGGLSWTCYYGLVSTCHAWRFSLPAALLFPVAYYAVKVAVLRGVSGLFEEEKAGALIEKLSVYHDVLFSVAAVPFLAFTTALEEGVQKIFFIILLIFLLLSAGYKILHTVAETAKTSKFSHLHIFVYLCALEIVLPLCMWHLMF